MAILPTADLQPDRFISVHKFWFKFFGQWYESYPILSAIFWLHLLYRVSVWWMLTVFPVGGEIIYVYQTGDDVGKVAEGLYLMLSEAYMAIKLIAFMYNRKKVLLLIDHLKSEDFYGTEPEHAYFIRNAIRKGRFVSKGYLYMCLCAITVGCLMPITERFAVLPTNVKYPYFDVMASPAYQIVYLLQIYSKTSVVLLDGALDTIMPAFIAQALGQLDVLSFNLENIQMLSERHVAKQKVSGKNEPNANRILTRRDCSMDAVIKEKLGKYINHHFLSHSDGVTIVCRLCDSDQKVWYIVRLKTLSLFNVSHIYVSKIEDAFSAAASIQFMLSGLVICLIGIQLLSIEDPMGHPLQLLWTLIYFSCMMSEIFMLCWFGDEVINKSYHLQRAAFNGNWFEFDEEVKRSLKIFMERSKKPLRLTAGKIFILSLDTFTNLLKWSYNAFAVMRNMKQ